MVDLLPPVGGGAFLSSPWVVLFSFFEGWKGERRRGVVCRARTCAGALLCPCGPSTLFRRRSLQSHVFAECSARPSKGVTLRPPAHTIALLCLCVATSRPEQHPLPDEAGSWSQLQRVSTLGSVSRTRTVEMPNGLAPYLISSVCKRQVADDPCCEIQWALKRCRM